VYKKSPKETDNNKSMFIRLYGQIKSTDKKMYIIVELHCSFCKNKKSEG